MRRSRNVFNIPMGCGKEGCGPRTTHLKTSEGVRAEVVGLVSRLRAGLKGKAVNIDTTYSSNPTEADHILTLHPR